MTTRPEHDATYRALFSNPEMIQDLLSSFVPREWIADLDFARMEMLEGTFTTAGAAVRQADMIWKVGRVLGPDLHVMLMLEFQSTVDRAMALRVLVYASLLLQRVVAQDPGVLDRGLPLLLPIVLYNGERKWSAATDTYALMSAPTADVLWKYQPGLSYCLIDENALASIDLEANKGLVSLLFQMERVERPEDLYELVEELIEACARPEYHQIRRDFVTWLVHALLPSNGIEVSNSQLEELREVKEMLKDRWAGYRQQVNEEVRAEVALEIREEVVRNVREEVALEIREEVALEIREEVALEIREEVVRDVRVEGLVRILVMQLEARFGPGCVDDSTLLDADEQHLQAMLAKVLDAESVDEVLGAAT